MPDEPTTIAPARFRRIEVGVLLALLVLLACLTGPRVFMAPLWGDELRTWRDGIEKPLGDVLRWQHNPDHAPLGHLLARGGAAIFGVEHAWSLRLGAWLCGLACVPALWWTGRTIWSSGVGLFMAGMFAVDPNISFQMTQARMYAPLMLAGVVSIALAASLLIRPGRPWLRSVLLGLAIGTGIWTHSQIYAVVIALLLVVLGLIATRRWRATLPLLIALIIGCGLGAQGIRKIAGRHDAEAVTTGEVTGSPGAQLEEAIHKLTGKRGISYLIGVAAVAGLLTMARRPAHRPVVALLAIIIVMALLNLLVAARYRPVAHARYLTILQPAVWLAMAVLIVELLRNTLGRAALVILAFSSFIELKRMQDSLEEHPLARPFADAARTIRASMSPGDRFVVVARSPYGMYTRYYGLSPDEAIDEALAPAPSPRVARARANRAALDRGVVWLLCVVPQPKIAYRYPLDEPGRVVRMIADGRTIEPGSLTELERTKEWHAAVVRIDEQQVEVRGVFPR
jgi:hypothetical protein